MAAYDLEEQEQIAELKAWWTQYGSFVVTVLLAVTLSVVGWQLWNKYRSTGATEAGALYSDLQQAALTGDAAQTRKIADKLISAYGNTVQAQMGALLSAGMQFQANDLDNARPHLEWAADKGKDAILRDLARLRLAAVLLQQGASNEALQRLQPAPEGHLLARFEDLRGDVLAAQGKAGEARAAWEAASKALGNLANDSGMRDVIRIKLETLKG